MTETPPPDAARHPSQQQPRPDDHIAAEHDQHVLGGVSRPTVEPVAAAREYQLQYP
jgi:hypothetical protein